MNIQIISNNINFKRIYLNDIQKNNFEINKLSEPKAFDEFDVNIIDLNYEEIWRYNGDKSNSINCISDLKHFKRIIEGMSNSVVLVLFPQNISYEYYYYNREYHECKSLKNMLSFLHGIVYNNIFSYQFSLNFETTTTIINNEEITADFSFDEIPDSSIALRSNKSRRINTIKVNKSLYYTTLNLCNSKGDLENFLYYIKILQDESQAKPIWLDEIKFLDDEKLSQDLNEINIKIEKLNEEKKEKIDKIEENNKFKSILYESGKSLQEEVIIIFNDMLKYNDNSFVDLMEEDYRIKLNDITFIIETKGLKGNVKGTHVSEAKNHVEVYIEENNCEETNENVKGIFVVGTEIEKIPFERQELPDRQVKLAKNNDLLIMRVEKLLELYEKYKKNDISTDNIIIELINQVGEFKLT